MTESTESYLERLNEKLRQDPEYEQDMAFLSVDERGYALLDPRMRQLQLGLREHDFSDAPFTRTILAVRRG